MRTSHESPQGAKNTRKSLLSLVEYCLIVFSAIALYYKKETTIAGRKTTVRSFCSVAKYCMLNQKKQSVLSFLIAIGKCADIIQDINIFCNTFGGIKVLSVKSFMNFFSRY